MEGMDARRPQALDGPWTQPGLVAIRMPESSRACGSLQGRWFIASAEGRGQLGTGSGREQPSLDAGRPLAAGMPRVFERRAGCSGTVVHLGRGFGDPGPGLGTGLRCRVPASAAFSDPARNIPNGFAGRAGRDGPPLWAPLMPSGGLSAAGVGSIAEGVVDAVAGLLCPPGGEALGERAARPSAALAVGDHLGQGSAASSPTPASRQRGRGGAARGGRRGWPSPAGMAWPPAGPGRTGWARGPSSNGDADRP